MLRILKNLVEIKKEPVLLQRQQTPGIATEALKSKLIETKIKFLAFHIIILDASLPANPVNDRRMANAVTLKSTFCLP